MTIVSNGIDGTEPLIYSEENYQGENLTDFNNW